MTDEPQTFVHAECIDSVLILTLERPERRNALCLDMYARLADTLTGANSDPQIGAVLLRGSGGCFCSGNDLRDFLDGPQLARNHPAVRFLYALHDLELPLVAEVSGPAIGIGTTMLLHCDLVYANETASFQLPFVALGLCPEAASSFLLPRAAGRLRAAEILLLGEPFDAEQALQWGLINELCKAEALHRHALDKARQLAQQPPGAVRLTKRLLKQSTRAVEERIMAVELRHFAERLHSEEAREAIGAWLERHRADSA